MTNIVKQCIAWNEARYDRVLNLDLALKLLEEETEELIQAADIVSKLDAIGDITFVAIGVLWKAGLNEDVICEMLGLFEERILHLDISSCDTSQLYNAFGMILHSVLAMDEIDTLEASVASSAAMLAIWHCSLTLRAMGLQQEYFNIVKAICDSNDTKEVKGKTDPSIKANIVKGDLFIPPTIALQRIISQYEHITIQ